MRYQFAFLFTQPPFGSAQSREGLDALLAASTFCDEDKILVAFINDGVFNLANQQQPYLIRQKDHIATFKLIELYELPNCLVCESSLAKRQLSADQLILNDIQLCSAEHLLNELRQAEKLLTF